MSFIILIPMVFCILALFRWPVARVFTDICLPVFLLLPIYYYWKVATLPPIDATEAVLIPVGFAMLFKELPRWRFTTMDLWLCVYIYSSYYADAVRNHERGFDLQHLSQSDGRAGALHGGQVAARAGRRARARGQADCGAHFFCVHRFGVRVPHGAEPFDDFVVAVFSRRVQLAHTDSLGALAASQGRMGSRSLRA